MMQPGPVLIHWRTQPVDFSRVVLTDRDGVLVDVSAPGPDGVAEVSSSPHASGALAELRGAGYAVLVVSNQSVVSRGVTTLDAAVATGETVLRQLDPDRFLIDWMVICPHAPDDRCRCRKPQVGGIRAVESETGQMIGDGWFIGDQASDMECGRTLGLRTALVATGHGKSTWSRLASGQQHLVDGRAATFADAVRRLVLRR